MGFFHITFSTGGTAQSGQTISGDIIIGIIIPTLYTVFQGKRLLE